MNEQKRPKERYENEPEGDFVRDIAEHESLAQRSCSKQIASDVDYAHPALSRDIRYLLKDALSGRSVRWAAARF